MYAGKECVVTTVDAVIVATVVIDSTVLNVAGAPITEDGFDITSGLIVRGTIEALAIIAGHFTEEGVTAMVDTALAV